MIEPIRKLGDPSSRDGLSSPCPAARRVLIETERLVLRPITKADLEDFLVHEAEPGRRHTIDDCDRRRVAMLVRADRRAWNERGHGILAVVDRASDRLVGRVALTYWPQFGETELGWGLRPDAWGEGIAIEAAGACAGWGFRTLSIPYLTAMIRPDNLRSLRVAQRLGMAPLRTDVLNDDAIVVYGIARSQWLSGSNGVDGRSP